jgi:hypothetical protein
MAGVRRGEASFVIRAEFPGLYDSEAVYSRTWMGGEDQDEARVAAHFDADAAGRLGRGIGGLRMFPFLLINSLS